MREATAAFVELLPGGSAREPTIDAPPRAALARACTASAGVAGALAVGVITNWAPAYMSLGLGAYVVALSLALRNAAIALSAILVIYLVPVTVLGPMTEALPFDIRILAVPFIAILAGLGRRNVSRRAHDVFVGFLLLTLLSAASAAWTESVPDTVAATVGLLIAVATWFSAARALSTCELHVVIARFLAVVLAGSAAMMVVGRLGLLGGRLRGLLDNPNGLGIIVVLALPILWSLTRHKLPLCAALASLLFLSASRAAAVAFLCELLILLLPLRRGMRRAAVIVVLLLFGVTLFLIASRTQGGIGGQIDGREANQGGILRRGDSRTRQWQGGMAAIRTSPFFGIGTGASSIEITSSSYLRLVVEGGLLAAVVAMSALMPALRLIPSNRLSAVLGIGGLTNAVFESWLFAGGSLYCLVFWMALVGLADEDIGRRHFGMSEGSGR